MVWCRAVPWQIGMVFAGSAATTMINEFGATSIIFTGVAGGLKADQKVGDLVIGTDVVNYEMDARSFKPPWDPGYENQLGEIPIMKWCVWRLHMRATTTRFGGKRPRARTRIAQTTRRTVRGRRVGVRRRFYEADANMLALAQKAPVPAGVTLSTGRLATGSIFLDGNAKKGMAESHWKLLDWPAAAEMENAGVAQICKAYNIPYLSLRALSDVLEGDANEDFGKFCQEAADNVFPIVQHVVKHVEIPVAAS